MRRLRALLRQGTFNHPDFIKIPILITPFGRDFCYAQHILSELSSALAYRKNSSFLIPPFGRDFCFARKYK